MNEADYGLVMGTRKLCNYKRDITKMYIMKKIRIQLFFLLFALTAFGQMSKTESFEINSKVFNGKRQIKVVLPENYSEYPNRKFKVIYLFDAQGESLFNFEVAAIDFLKSGSVFIEPSIIVGIESTNRWFEFLPKNQSNDVYKYYGKGAKFGGADSLAISLRDEIIPFVQSKYRCNNYNIGIGHSLGGTFLTYSLVKFPQLFNAVIAISPNYWYDNEQVLNTFNSLASKDNLHNKFLYIAYGEGDMLENRFLPSTIKMDGLLSKLQISTFRWQTNKINIGSHYLSPIEGVAKGLLALNKEFVTTEDQIEKFHLDSNNTFISTLKKYFQTQSDIMGLQLPTIEYLNNLAYNSTKEDAIPILEWAISLYPDDANFYDSMGEFQQNAGNTKEARKYYSGGLKIIENEKTFLQPTSYQDKVNWFEGRIKETEKK